MIRDIDSFFRKMHIDKDCKVDGYKIDTAILIELLTKFAQQQVKNLNILAVINRRELLIAFYKWQYEDDKKLKDVIPYEKDVNEFLYRKK